MLKVVDEQKWLCDERIKLLFRKCHHVSNCGELIRSFLYACPDMVTHILRTQAVLIKVNLTGDVTPETGKTTNPLILKLLVDLLVSVGVERSRIIVADSSVIGVDTMKAAQTTGILEVCRCSGITFVDLNEGPFSEVKLSNGRCNSTVHLNELALAKDVFRVNCAKIKTTYGSPVSLCVKNLKGFVSSETKFAFHLNGVQESLIDLRHIVTCDLNILEGFPGSELGNPRACDIFGVSNDDVSLDGIISTLIGIPVRAVLHLEELIAEDESRLRLLGSLDASAFKNAEDFRFSIHGVSDLIGDFGVEVVDGKPCTACVECIYRVLYKLSEDSLDISRYTYVLGLWHVATEWERYEGKSIVFVGKCALQSVLAKGILAAGVVAAKLPEEKRFLSLAVPGCPPTVDSISAILKKALGITSCAGKRVY